MFTTDFFIKAMLVVALGAAAVLAAIWIVLALGEFRRMRQISKLRRMHDLRSR